MDVLPGTRVSCLQKDFSAGKLPAAAQSWAGFGLFGKIFIANEIRSQ